MALFRPEVRVTLFPRKDKNKTTEETPIPTSPDIDGYIASAEAAATRLGKQVVLGAIVVSVATIGAATLGSVIVTAVEHALDK